ncbi:histidine kinase [Oceanibaculum pacificum]|uniref:histidine kinase n=1 Tax=Oceanibaculum pacificum TaxID=580166 RepID=A0A154WFP6_9PROT|nr:histidine kinase [Oceanibaculum pacificum]
MRRRRRWRWSPLTTRILAINLLALGLLVAGVFYVDEYRRGLIEAELQALRLQADLFAEALGAGAVQMPSDDGVDISGELARQLVRRLEGPMRTRLRVFRLDGELIADSRLLRGPYGTVQIEPLPPIIERPGLSERVANTIYDWVMNWLPTNENLPAYAEAPVQSGNDYPEVRSALQGDPATELRQTGDGRMLLSVAVPVQSYRQVLGALMITGTDKVIDERVRAVRIDILKVFTLVFTLTVALSLYLAGTITRPLSKLAAAAERMRQGMNRQYRIPDFRRRNDEIGDLSGALIEMTEAIWQRMDAIERFAADVSHEIKNPLTSLRSAVETAARVKDPDQQKRLMAVILDDVQRLDRLISDISDASRLDSELSRADAEPVDITVMLSTLIEVYMAVTREEGPSFSLSLPKEKLVVLGLETRLGQVVRNLISNAISFSPPDGTIAVSARRHGNWVLFTVEDEGPGIPENKLADIFNRFYTERPKGEKFGRHSGLGLSISKQIVEALSGTITAENRRDADGNICGARFTVRLPKA